MKRAVILFNLGGPDSLEAVRPFLFNLFNDPFIISVPALLRRALAFLISWRRTNTAKEIYQQMGGMSPICAQTNKQALALEAELGPEYKVFVVMRYWHPRADDVFKQVVAYAPEDVILLPLYPHFSSTTSLSSLLEWSRVQKWDKAPWSIKVVKAYPTLPGLISYYVREIKKILKTLPEKEACRLLFSAHGLPEKVIQSGDPYQKHIVESARAIQQQLPQEVECLVSYQSRVGPLKWLDPYTDVEIARAGQDKKHLIVVPIAFVSEHSETLVELDIEYLEIAEHAGVLSYHRVSTPQDNPDFIEGLADLVRDQQKKPFQDGIYSCINWECPKRLCNPKVCCLARS